MKQLLKTLVALLMMFSIYSAYAQLSPPVFNFYPVMGKVEEVRGTVFVINDSKYETLPTLKVILDNKKMGKIDDIKIGDQVGLNLVTINHRLLVDKITILPKVK